MFGFYLSNTEMKVTGKMSLQLDINSNMSNAHRLRSTMSPSSTNFMGKKDDFMCKHEHAVFKGNNIKINTTDGYNSTDRVSFLGAPAKAGKTFTEAVVESKLFEKFCDMANKNSAIAEAVGALFITCIMRPAAIMAMPQKDIDKNRKAASHSIASGVTGLVFAKIAYEPFAAAMKKVQESLNSKDSKYLSQKAKDFLKEEGREIVKNGMTKKISNYDCFNQFITYGPKVLTASILAAFTVGTMPYIDKYVIDKYILKNKPKPNDKPVFTTTDHFKFVTFRRTPEQNQVFQSFKGVNGQW